MKPGEYVLDDNAGPIRANTGRKTVRVLVKNSGDRPVQVGSHYHFFEVNRALAFDRATSYGMRLNIAAGTAVRFEPGDEKEVELTELAGSRIVHGFSGLVKGRLDEAGKRQRAIEKAFQEGFGGSTREKER